MSKTRLSKVQNFPLSLKYNVFSIGFTILILQDLVKSLIVKKRSQWLGLKFM